MVNKNSKTLKITLSEAENPPLDLMKAIRSAIGRNDIIKVEFVEDEPENDVMQYNGNNIIPSGGDIEREYEENLGGFLGVTIYNMRENNNIVAKEIGASIGMLAASLTEKLVSEILDYTTEAVAHASDSARRDAVEMCTIVK